MGARDPEGESKRWVEEFSQRLGTTYQELMERMGLYADLSSGPDDDLYESIKAVQEPMLFKTFWHHYEVLTGTIISNPETEYFSCSC